MRSKLLNIKTSIRTFKEFLYKTPPNSKFLIELDKVLRRVKPKALNNNENEVTRFKSELENSLKANGAYTNKFITSVFGFSLPGRATILLSKSNKTKSGVVGELATMLIDDPPMVCININAVSKIKSPPLINLVHELLHAIIYKKKLIDYNIPGSGMLEEVLIRYTTEGMLERRLGLSKHASINGCYNNIISNLSGSKTMALRMRNLMKSYDEKSGNRTVWSAIEETSLRRMFGMRPPGTKG